jgi:siroheme synthase
VVQSAWQPGERSHVSTLGALAADIARLGFRSPAILVIGEVARSARAAARAAAQSR